MISTHIKDTLAGLVRQQQPGASLDNPHYISLHLINKWLNEVAFDAAQGVMLDYGCGGQPYKAFFAEKITRYIGADVAAAHSIQLDLEIVLGERLDLPDSSIDTILSTQTLEHVPDISFYIGECSRLLRPNGNLILTAPMQWRHHEIPYDYFRFTKYGLEGLLVSNGFTIESMHPCGGVYALLGQIFLSHLHERGVRNKYLNKLVNRIALSLDERFPDFEDTLNWMCIAVRQNHNK